MTNVVSCIDAAALNDAVCDYSGWAAQQLEAPVTLLHVLEEQQRVQPDVTGNIGLGTREHLLDELAELDEKRAKLALQHGHLLLEQAAKKVQAQGVTVVTQRQRHGTLSNALLDMEDDMRLCVLGLHGEDSANQLHKVGSQLETVIRTVHCPLLLTPSSYTAPKQAMFAYDGSATASKGVETLAQSPLVKGMAVHVVMVADASSKHQEQLAWAKEQLENGGHHVSTALLQGEVEPSLHAYQKQYDIDLMVMGAFGHSRIRQFLIGSTTMKMLQESTSPVLVLR
ncbi:universal stress protein [Pseudidiomarina sediminum]|uniref:universal stress protein n=1 Tax=Pseudidiomarina sediminum TaxID=431675 RepID=UPI001C95D5F9|nr:universal stress protein [Pseudidiomarina sediminum]MBY6064913.1 universal stress protein [Pseudidiomarina sediminum]